MIHLLIFLFFIVKCKQQKENKIILSFNTTNPITSIATLFELRRQQFPISIDITSEHNILFTPSNLTFLISKNQNEITINRTFEKINYTTHLKSIFFIFDDIKKVSYGSKQLVNIIPINNMQTFSTPHYPMSSVSFSRKFTHNETSFIYSLASTRLITKKVFSIEYEKNDEGKLILGSQDYLISLKKNCTPIEPEDPDYWSSWGCMLSGIFFGNDYKKDGDLYYIDEDTVANVEIRSQVYFSTVEEKIIVSCSVIDYFKEHYFKKFIEIGKCWINETVNEKEGKMIKCDLDDYMHFENVNFVFEDKLGFIILGKTLFDEKGNFNVVCYEKNERNAFIFGYYFLRNWITKMDYEEDLISFYSSFGEIEMKPINYLDKIIIDHHLNKSILTNKQWVILLYNINSGLSFLGVLILFSLITLKGIKKDNI